MDTAARLTETVARGAWGTVEFAVRGSGDVPAKDFLGTLDDTAVARFAVLFQLMANYGKVSPKRFKKEMGKLFAFKHEVDNQQIRFPCFQDGNRWIITHGFVKPGAQKKKGKWPPAEIDRAQTIQAEYLTRKRRMQGPKGKR